MGGDMIAVCIGFGLFMLAVLAFAILVLTKYLRSDK